MNTTISHGTNTITDLIQVNELPDRILNKIELEPNSGCWLWTATTTPKGYGRVWWESNLMRAHRLVYELLIGPIPDGLQIDHLCRVRHCVNPEHLEPVTHAENVRRGESGKYLKDKTHCPHGHEYSESNTYVSKNGARHCRECRRGARAAYLRRRAKARALASANKEGGGP